MANKTKIEYVDATWNPVVGCSKVSAGCANCWAERQAKRWGQDWGTVRLHPERLSQPLRWRKPRRIAVCFMGDLFHEQVPDAFIDRVFLTMAWFDRHTYLVLTKRPDRMRSYMDGMQRLDRKDRANRVLSVLGHAPVAPEYNGGMPWPLPNVILGVSVEDQATADERIPILLDTPAARRWVSIEPMLGPVDLSGLFGCDKYAMHHGLDWVVLGGESGPGARPMHPDWVRRVRDDCAAAGVPFWFKQWGSWVPGIPSDDVWNNAAQHHWIMDGRNPYSEDVVSYRVGKRAAGRLLDGREHAEVPA